MYWLMVAVWARALFVWSYYDDLPDAVDPSWHLPFLHGLPLDLSLAGYIITVSLILFVLYSWTHRVAIATGYQWWHYLTLSLYILITIADIAVYRHWNTKLNLPALQFVRSPREVLSSIGQGDQPTWWLVMFVGSIVLFVYLYQKLLSLTKSSNNHELRMSIPTLATVIFCLGLCFIAIRGGFQQNPINQSSAYYSDVPLFNHAAINATWNLIFKIVNNRGGKNPYHFGDDRAAAQAIQHYYRQDTTDIHISTVRKPNVVYIILEGFTSDVIAAFGGESGLTPTLDSLVQHSLIWTRFYANGDRTYKGLPSILSGIPTQPNSSITQNPDQAISIPSMAKSLKPEGYRSSFYYGGESEFANIKAYLLHTGYDTIIDIHNFPTALRGKKWGVPDHFVFERLAEDLAQMQQPFFATVLTLSSHEPYDIPVEPLIKSNAWPDLFRNTVHYTDASLGKFLKQVQTQSWYDSTLFVLTADHGNPMPKDYANNFHPGKFKIPLMIFGPALNAEYRGKAMDIVGSHTDLTYSLLSALHVKDTMPRGYRYSNNLFSSRPGSAYYTFDHGFGFVNDKTRMAYDLISNKVVHQEGPVSDSLIQLGKLLIQGTFDPK